MTEKFFTVEEANALLPDITTLLYGLRDKQEALAFHQIEVEERKAEGPIEPYEEEAFTRKERLVKVIGREIIRMSKEISNLGCHVKSPDLDLIDFPSYRDGAKVFLCWRMRESEVGYWHTWNGGYAGRKAIEDPKRFEKDPNLKRSGSIGKDD